MFSLFHYCIPLENGQVLNLSRFDPLFTRFLRAKLDRNWPRGSSAEDETQLQQKWPDFDQKST